MAGGRTELLALDDQDLETLLWMFAAVVEGADWPTTFLWGMVVLLYKGESSSPEAMRPITLFCVALRAYTSATAKRALAYIAGAAFCPVGVRGNLPGREASDIVSDVAIEVEAGHVLDYDVHHAALDVVK